MKRLTITTPDGEKAVDCRLITVGQLRELFDGDYQVDRLALVAAQEAIPVGFLEAVTGLEADILELLTYDEYKRLVLTAQEVNKSFLSDLITLGLNTIAETPAPKNRTGSPGSTSSSVH